MPVPGSVGPARRGRMRVPSVWELRVLRARHRRYLQPYRQRGSCVLRPESGNLYVERQTKRHGMTASNWSTFGLLKNYWSTYPEDSSLTRDTYVLGYKILMDFGAKLSGG